MNKNMKTVLCITLNSLLIKGILPVQNELSTAFYDSMFGAEQLTTEINAVEAKALANVRAILNNPEKLSNQIPPLPAIYYS